MLHVTQLVTIDAPANIVWQTISNFGAGSKYLAMVTHCKVQGLSVGALRTLTYLDGSVILERLESVEEALYCLSYRLLSDTPFGNCLTSMALRALSPDQAELHWTADFQPTSLPPKEAVALMEGMLADNCQVLKQLLEG